MLLYHTDFEIRMRAGIAQAAERILGKDEVGSSSLPISSIENRVVTRLLCFLFTFRDERQARTGRAVVLSVAKNSRKNASGKRF